MIPAALIDRIDWPATGLLIAGLLLPLLVLLMLLRRRGRTAARLPLPADASSDAQSRELRELRLAMQEEVDALRAEIAQLRQEMGGIKAARGVAPQYGEAMTLAGRGASAHDIADQCGISVAEAELVRALGHKIKD